VTSKKSLLTFPPERAENRPATEHGRNRNHDRPGPGDAVPDPPEPLPQRHLRPQRGDPQQAVPPVPRRVLQRDPQLEFRPDVGLDQTPEPEVPGHLGQPYHLRHQRRLQVLGRPGNPENVEAGEVHQDRDGVVLEPEEPEDVRTLQLAQGRLHGHQR